MQFGEGNSVTCIAAHQVPKLLEEKFTLLRYFSQVTRTDKVTVTFHRLLFCLLFILFTL